MNTITPGHLEFRQALSAMLGICLVLMLSALDQTVVSNALPRIAVDLNGFNDYAWVASSYLLTSMVSIPIFGRLGDYYGRKPIVAIAAIIFIVSSLGCGLANNIIELVIGRAIQGIGGGMLAGTAFACVPELFPETRQRLKWQVMLNASFSFVNALGPSLGGFLTAWVGWRSIFYLNLPIGLIGFIVVIRWLPWFKPARSDAFTLDVPGLVFIASSLCLLQLFVQNIPELFQHVMPALYGLATIASFICLWLIEKRANAPILPGILFSDRNMRLIFIISILVGGTLFTLLFYIPLLCQGSLGFDATRTGILITPMVVTTGISAIINTRIVRRISNPNWVPRIGLIILFLSCSGLAFTTAGTSFIFLMMLMLLSGIGFGFTFLNTTLFIQALAPHEYLGIATALVQGLRLVGGVVGTAGMLAITTIFYHFGISSLGISLHQTGLMQQLGSPDTLLNARVESVPMSTVLLARQVLGHAIAIGLAGLAIVVLLAVVCMWKVKPIDLMKRS